MEFGRVYSIPAERSFVDALADGLLRQWGDDPLALSEVLVLLPTRRACRSLREAFLRRAQGAALLLPRMRPIGDVDMEEMILGFGGGSGLDVSDLLAELPPPISALRRTLFLAELIRKTVHGFDNPTPEQAAILAADLARLLDQVHIEGLSLDNLDRLAPERFAENWQHTLLFLNILRENWPKILEEEGTLDPGEWQTAMRRAQADLWRADPPGHPVIAAGSTGSVPATADLLSLILELPQGMVVLPGLDRTLEDRAWIEVGRDQGHPQFGLSRLLTRFGIDRNAVLDWPGGTEDSAAKARRVHLLSEAMRPAAASDAWRHLPDFSAADMEGVSQAVFDTSRSEAVAIAMMMRRTLEAPTKRAALVTPDRSLARRVAAELRRWGLTVDDSAGLPLGATVPGSFLRLIAETVNDGFSPSTLLAVLKHPLARGGRSAGAFRAQVRLLERWVLRGPKPAPGFDGLQAALQGADMRDMDQDGGAVTKTLSAFITELEQKFQPLTDLMRNAAVTLRDCVGAHGLVAETLAEDAENPGADRLWAGEAGEALALFVQELSDGCAGLFADIGPQDYPGLLDAMLSGRVVRPRYGAHPRLFIWGPLEARLQHVDLVILGGLNEGVWPPEPETDAWMSRPMRQEFGLPAPERRIGLSAHDFAQAFAAPQVVLTRAEKVDGQPTVPSRWLSRLHVVLDALDLSADLKPADPWTGWADMLERSCGPAAPVPMPAPRPPVAARPTRLSVTRIETLMRDPYSIFARYILDLKVLDPLEADPGAAERGTFIHQALERFVADHAAGPLPADARDALMREGEAAFGPVLGRPAVRAFWWPRFERIADWFLREEAKRRGALAASFVEQTGRTAVPVAGTDFTIQATADRIDRMTDGRFVIMDYKTGQPPSKKDVKTGKAPQMPLEALILADGGFGTIGPGEVAELQYWRLSGGSPAGKVVPVDEDVSQIVADVRDGLVALIGGFMDPGTPYLPTPRSALKMRFNDYDHLSRKAEWSAGGEGDQ
ncbi:double-strand break repair protein AddB [Hwanghaeella sp.]|uniref:double-strand break repair protein AddB n=1 Tax=Hwanghaeella sp. TaxID=2605943 RepID=UPI003CCC2ED6